MLTKLIFFTGFFISMILIISCGSDVNRNANQSNFNLNSMKNTPSVKFDSGGIGLDKKDWEETHGMEKPSVEGMYEYKFDKYDYDKLRVKFSSNLRIKYIEWDSDYSYNLNPVGIYKFIPSDAKRKNRTTTKEPYSTTRTQTIEFYTSETLKSRFPESEFNGGNAGEFIIIYSTDTLNKKTISFSIKIGGN